MAKIFKSMVVAMICFFAFIAVFAFAYLQEFYRLNPPTEEERAEHPILIAFLTGGDE